MKKVLIITYYWPPSGGAGVQRVLKFAKYLPQFGWEPHILTVENGDAPIIDESLLDDIPEECKVYKTSAFEPYNIYKKFTGKTQDEKIPYDVLLNKKPSLKEKISLWIRLNLFVPDAKIGWIPSAVKKAVDIIKKENIDLIFSSSPPHTVQLIAKKTAKKTGLKWISDFRDPWMEMLHNQQNNRFFLTKMVDSHLEKKSLKTADRVITISKGIVEDFNSKVNNNYYIIPNGYDETDFDYSIKSENEELTVSYTGVMSVTRLPEMFLKSVQKLKKENQAKIKLQIAGKTCPEFESLIDKYELRENFNFLGYLSHKESTKVLMKSDLLLLVVDNIPNNKGFLTGKIFEYLGCKKNIFAVGPVNGDAHQLIKDSKSGVLLDYNDEAGTYDALLGLYKDWEEKKIRDDFETEKYSRRNLTKELVKVFEEIN